MAALLDIFKKDESFIAIDIGATSVKLLEFDLEDEKPKLINVGIAPLSGEIFSNHVINKPDKVSEALAGLLEQHQVGDRRVVTAVPGPSVFTKRIKMPKADPTELRANVQFEAANFIPHNIDAVKLDFQILRAVDKADVEVLVVAVKNEIIESFTDCLALSGLETAIVDVDYFAMQNMFELCYPNMLSKTAALINMGARYSSISICRGGESLFTGDIGVGGKTLSDELMQQLQVNAEQAEEVKKTAGKSGVSTDADKETARELIEKNVEYVAGEFNRQLSFFWNASGADEGIDVIMVTGGASQLPGLTEELTQKTGIDCLVLDPIKGLERAEHIEKSHLAEISPFLAVAVGMGIREVGDKIVPEID